MGGKGFAGGFAAEEVDGGFRQPGLAVAGKDAVGDDADLVGSAVLGRGKAEPFLVKGKIFQTPRFELFPRRDFPVVEAIPDISECLDGSALRPLPEVVQGVVTKGFEAVEHGEQFAGFPAAREG